MKKERPEAAKYLQTFFRFFSGGIFVAGFDEDDVITAAGSLVVYHDDVAITGPAAWS
jgi:hypothetical protein